MHPVQLKCEFQIEPIVDKRNLRLSWQVQADGRGNDQTAWRVRVWEQAGTKLWDSEKVVSREVWCHTPELALKSGTKYRWDVTLWDGCDRETGTAESGWETALLHSTDWKAKWIEPVQKTVYHEVDIDMGEMFAQLKRDGKIPFDYNNIYPCPMLRREFELPDVPVNARMYCTAHGLYRVELNGERVTKDEFTPGYAPYDKLLPYQTYDVTDKLRGGSNALGILLADGWYAGRIGGAGDNCQYGDRLGFLMQMELTWPDGRKTVIASDEYFRSSFGPLCYSDLFLGEKYDARLDSPGWSTPGYPDGNWTPVLVTDEGYENLAAEYGPPVRVTEVLPAREIIHTPAGETVVDFGQVVAGRVSMRVLGPAGTEIVLEHSEVLDEHGNFINNIYGRYKDQTDHYILKGGEVEEYTPVFTFHGFRYVRLTGYPGQVKSADFQAEVLTSCMEPTGTFTCSNADLNQLQHNLSWSLKGNTLSIPTDCPQRERAGWTGDVQIIAPTACYNLDIAAFFGRYLQMMRMEQAADGQIPIVIPFIPSYRKGAKMPLAPNILPDNITSAGWGDVCTLLPWSMYQYYGDKKVLEENYSMMKAWVSYISTIAENYLPENTGELTPERRERMKYLWNTNFHFGDWLAPTASIDPETGMVDMERSAKLTNQYIPACFYALSTQIAADTAKVLGHEKDAAHYILLNQKIRAAFAEEYIDEHGRLPEALQGLYVMALQCGLAPPEKRELLASHLVELIESNGDRLDTGFVSVPYLMDVLQQNGRLDKAYTLLYQESCPSWLYEVRHGATTIWESWQAILPDGRVGKDSYNHYAFGCIGDWMYRNLAGINSAAPGYAHIVLHPQRGSGLTWAQATHETVYGTVSLMWSLEEETWSAKIPPNTTAEFWIPGGNVREGKMPAVQSPGVLAERMEKGYTVLEVGSGTYDFTFRADTL